MSAASWSRRAPSLAAYTVPRETSVPSTSGPDGAAGTPREQRDVEALRGKFQLVTAETTAMDLTYYTVEQVSEQTGMGKDWLWQQCRDRKIAHHRLGRTYRFTADDLAPAHASDGCPPQRRGARG